MKFIDRSIHGSTLSEVLVAMVLSGIVLLCVSGGFDTAGRLLGKIASESGFGMLDGHMLMDNLMYKADSLNTIGNMVVFFSSGEAHDTLVFGDNAVSFRSGGNVIAVFDEYSGYSLSEGLDSLCIMMRDKNNDIRRLEYGLKVW